ncbi:hypothetical protein [Mangrovitalea sediminis]|uniref:hypothetical protein n=1 Tax=Mangrovitalea sediminis TaxID=1982043 RepID=UPI000BE5C4AE|nr:hypothetical protein [Mangrovitalea sediminis]
MRAVSDSSNQRADANTRLNRLYDLKQQQLLRAQGHSDSLLYRVLNAEAEAISDALKDHQQDTP